MSQPAHTIESLKARWYAVRHRTGIWESPSPEEEAGALLDQHKPAAATAYARRFADPDGHGYWAQVVRLLEPLAEGP